MREFVLEMVLSYIEEKHGLALNRGGIMKLSRAGLIVNTETYTLFRVFSCLL